ncbi:MAG: hypothetical protein ACOZAN_01515 [Patescibacteria group bacterium]
MLRQSMSSQSQDFIAMLQEEAELQAKLQRTRLLPARLDFLSRFVATHAWQTVLVSSFLTALILWLGQVAGR